MTRRATRAAPGGTKAKQTRQRADANRQGIRAEHDRRVALYASQVASGGEIRWEPRAGEGED